MNLPPCLQAVVFPAFLLCQVMALGCSSSDSDTTPRPGRITTTALGTFAVAAVVPGSGTAGNAVDVTVYGKGFQPGATVSFDGVPANSVVVNASTITTTAPPHPAGNVAVVVTNPGGDSARLNGSFTYLPLAITSVSPSAGFAGELLQVIGTGFLPGAVVTLDGARPDHLHVTNSVIWGTAPSHAPGAVNVVVTNPDGQTAVLNGGFVYVAVSLSATPSSVTAGSRLTVTWTTTPGRASPSWDWIGLFRVGTSNFDYLDYQYTGGTSGTQTWTAPPQAGQYEFRYLPNDDYFDVARSNSVTVVGATATSSSPLTFPGPGPSGAAGRSGGRGGR